MYDAYVDSIPVALTTGGLNEVYVSNGKIIGVGRDRGRIMFSENYEICLQLRRSSIDVLGAANNSIYEYIDCRSE